MHAALSRYVEAVRRHCAAHLSLPARLSRIANEARGLVAEGPLPLGTADRFVPEDGYGRNLLYRDPEHGFVVIAMVWPPGAGGDPHDHCTWGVVAVSEGPVLVENFLREDDGSDREQAVLVPTSTLEGNTGDIGTVLPPHEDIHAISNPSSDATSVSIHTYGRDITRCRVFDRRTGRIQVSELSYHHEPVA